VFSNLRELRTELQQQRDLFVADYSQILKSLEEQLGDELYAKAKKKLPEATAIASKFSVVWAIVPCGGSSIDRQKVAMLRGLVDGLNVRSNVQQETKRLALALIDELDTRDVSQVTDQEADDLIREARQQMNSFTREMLDDLSREPRQMLADASQNLIEALQDKNRVIRNGTIEQVRRAFQMVEDFSFLAGPELLERMQQVRNSLDDATPQILNSNAAAGAALADALRGVRDVAADAQVASEAMRSFRNIRIRTPVEA
jgi:hypothetical protein